MDDSCNHSLLMTGGTLEVTYLPQQPTQTSMTDLGSSSVLKYTYCFLLAQKAEKAYLFFVFKSSHPPTR